MIKNIKLVKNLNLELKNDWVIVLFQAIASELNLTQKVRVELCASKSQINIPITLETITQIETAIRKKFRLNKIPAKNLSDEEFKKYTEFIAELRRKLKIYKQNIFLEINF